jgi:hypothetical protein
MIQYQFFPRSHGLTAEMGAVVDCFERVAAQIDSTQFQHPSNDVLALLRPHLERLQFKVEVGKSKLEKISVPVLFGRQNTIDKSFNADALSHDGKIVIEVEAGRATANNQFLKDVFQVCMMHGVEYLVIAVRNVYAERSDFDIVHGFLETLYISNRLHLPLNGILLIGY